MADEKSTVSEITQQFGVVIAFLLPGFVVLWALQFHSSVVRLWLGGLTSTRPAEAPTGGSFLLAVTASLALGMLVSGLRWIIYDCLVFRLLLQDKSPDQVQFGKLAEKLPAVTLLIENHYRFFQYYANSSVGLALAGISEAVRRGFTAGEFFLVLGIEIVLGFAAHDSWKKYYTRLTTVLS